MGQKDYNGETLKTTETMEILKGRMQLAPVKNTKLIAITVYSDDKNEAAELANAMAGSYRQYRFESRSELALTGLGAAGPISNSRSTKLPPTSLMSMISVRNWASWITPTPPATYNPSLSEDANPPVATIRRIEYETAVHRVAIASSIN